MPTEQIDFTFLLFATGIVTPVPYTITINNTIVDKGTISRNGRHAIVTQTLLEQGPATIGFNIIERFKGSIRLENIKLAWMADNSGLNSAWVNSDDAPNVVWCYNDPEAANQFEKITNGPNAKIISLDYYTDESAASFLRNYGVSINDDGQTIKMKDTPTPSPHIFVGKSSFQLPMTSPVAYWLMERLFVAL